MKHSQLTGFARELGYGHDKLTTEEGLCKGFSAMWIQAVCCGDLASFNQRLSLLERYNSSKKLKNDVNKALERSKLKEKLTEDEKKLLEIPAFFEGIAFYLSPEKLNIITEKSFYQNNEIELSKYLQSQKLEEKGGLALAFQTTDQYMPADLVKYLKNMSYQLKNKTEVAIDLSANNHSVAIRVVGNDQFQLIDTNNLTKKDRIYNSKELAGQLYSSFPNNSTTWLDLVRPPKTPPLIMSTSVFTNSNNPLNIDSLRNMTPLKNLPTNTASSLLIKAAHHNDTNLLKRINFDKINSTDIVDCLIIANHFKNDKSADYVLTQLNKNLRRNYALHAIATMKYLAPNIRLLVKTWIEQGADLNQQDSNGDTPFLLAIKTGNTLLAADFLNYGVDCNIRNKKNVTALEIACKHNHTIFIGPLLKDTTLTRKNLLPSSPLVKLIPKCDIDTQKKFLKKSLQTYIAKRKKSGDYLNFFNLGIHKNDKIAAAQALLDTLEGNEASLQQHHAALHNGLLSSIYKFYGTLKTPPPNPNNKPSSYSHLIEKLNVTKASRNQMPLNPDVVKKTETNLNKNQENNSELSSSAISSLRPR